MNEAQEIEPIGDQNLIKALKLPVIYQNTEGNYSLKL